MKDLLSQKEKEKYQKMWTAFPDYRKCSPGELFASHFFQAFEDQLQPNDHIIDFGCGTGRVTKQFLEKELSVTLVDICSVECLDPEIQLLLSLFPNKLRFIEASLWDLPPDLPTANWLYCCDVLEHIPTEKVPQVLQGIASHTLKGGFISICLKDDFFGPQNIQKPLHLTVKPRPWWLEQLAPHWSVVQEFPSLEDSYLNCALLFL